MPFLYPIAATVLLSVVIIAMACWWPVPAVDAQEQVFYAANHFVFALVGLVYAWIGLAIVLVSRP